VSELLEVQDLHVGFSTDTEDVKAVRGMTFDVKPREVVALVGESGAGKSATAMAVVGLLPEYARVSGSVRLHGDELIGLDDQRMSRIRGRVVGTVFQDPMSALTPVYPVGQQIAEALRVHQRDLGRTAAATRAVELLELVGISQPQRRAKAFPHELSGGERQRVAIARAVVGERHLLLADEPSGALDSANGETVMRLVRETCQGGVAGVVVTHDAQLAAWADRVVFLRDGRVVDQTAPAQGPESLLDAR
jgi:peptide/nickel transport system ATP-binding protein